VYDLVLLDLDGVVYIGRAAVPGAAGALARVRAAGVRTAFVTNNASRPPQTVGEHLRELGIDAADDDVVTSAQAAAAVLARRLPGGAKVLIVGGEGLYRAIEAVGLKPVQSADDQPMAVVQGFSPDIGWRLLAEGSRAVRSGLPWIATNVDLTVPTPYGPAPGNGTLVAAIATATGVRPEVAGKPQPTLFLEAAERYRGRRPLVVGDRLDTDLEGARAAGMDGLAVLTGVHRVRDLIAAAPQRRPHLISRDLNGLLVAHPGPERTADGWGVGGTVVAVDDAGLHIVRAGVEPLDLIRAGCAAAWDYADSRAGSGAGSDSDPGSSSNPGSGRGSGSGTDQGVDVAALDPDALLDALYSLDRSGPWGL
jgi:HAD superfamily hydrolase (TIGR01450 family)